MSYATRADIETVYGADELRLVLNLARDATLATADEARVAAALAETAGQIDAYLVRRYSLPLAVVPVILRGFAVDMTMYRLALRQGRPRDELRTRYEDAVKFLTHVSDGKAELPGVGGTDAEGGAEADGGSSGNVMFTDEPRRIRRDTEVLS